jgi:DNA invertase Pin-like site-specific DNA recombinase
VPLVEVMGRYCRFANNLNRNKRTLDLQGRTWSDPVDPDRPIAGRVSFRLADADIQQLVAEYQSGTAAHELAERYGLARSTVLVLLRKQGVPIRYPQMTPEDCSRVVELYRFGVSQVEIARQLGRHKSVVWHVLERAGLKGTGH